MATVGTVLLAPGFGGSELTYHPDALSFFGPGILWIAYDRLLFYFERLDWGAGYVEPRNAINTYYGPLTQRLWNRGWRVVAPRLDWRGDVAGDAVVAADLINSEFTLHGQPVHLLGHSRGGLVLRKAIALLNAAGHLNRVGRCVGMGVPHRGTLSPATLLGGVNDTLLAVYSWQQTVQLGVVKGDWPQRVSKTIASWPGVYGLLPDPGHAWLTSGELDRIYTRASYEPWSCSQTLLDAGKASWPNVPELPQGVAWLDIVGTGSPTPNALVAGKDLSSKDAYKFATDGDGTVWLGSLVGWPVPAAQFKGVGHDALPQYGPAIDAADAWFRG